MFTDEAEAVRAYDKAKELHEAPKLNFLPDGTPNPGSKKYVCAWGLA